MGYKIPLSIFMNPEYDKEFDMFLNINTKEDLKKAKENIDKI